MPEPDPIHEGVHFFMVWNKRGRSPRATHRNRTDAETEATRLATANPGQKFIVLQAVNKIHVPLPPADAL